jgi:1-pyrroline-5-carboxylate dehydrogenase
MQLTEFRNEPLRDFKGNPEHERRMREALDEVRQELGQEYDVVIDGERIKTQDKFYSYNPGQKDEVVGVFSKSDAELADRAIRAADEAFKTWSHTPAEQRAELALETARMIRERKFHYAAWMCYEVGKTWAEADADVAEPSTSRSFMGAKSSGLSSRSPSPQSTVRGILCVTSLLGWGL